MQIYLKKFIRLIFGLYIYALGLVLCIYANIGLAPWDAFAIGISKVTGISYGNVSILIGITIVIALFFLLKEKIGFGTILNAILIGFFSDLIIDSKIIPYMQNFFTGVLMLVTGQILACIASYLYIGVGLGAGPRDSLMIGLGKKFSNIPIGIVRGSIEATVLFIGWILGAKVGLGTVIYVFSIGFLLQTTFKLLKFDVKSVVHESVFDTINIFKKIHSENI
ncbi:MAG TPA: hypothetical protein PK516_03365 [Sedimentibacter sp.]|jgi:uncharacterized membrane protein YczE|nr:hypothetical protein [Clostridiales bacterium]HOA20328.1 hypothetical protein [Sedimentibacter sp.]HOG63172.1 hypothetical protein [Sedimentibacter sp.]HOT21195.1 hypothetical protein [Sedimentibacter sp.]HPB79451.1 hypothetical protein [Sedimentibacter sp.]